jgi:hypothetical protein
MHQSVVVVPGSFKIVDTGMRLDGSGDTYCRSEMRIKVGGRMKRVSVIFSERSGDLRHVKQIVRSPLSPKGSAERPFQYLDMTVDAIRAAVADEISKRSHNQETRNGG